MMVPIKKADGIDEHTPAAPNKKKLSIKILYVLLGISAVFLLTAGIVSKTRGKTASTRQAVFVSTGSVYFGYVEDASSTMVKVKDVYYVSSIQSLYPGKDSKEKISLIKMGSEVYKPQGSILINRDQIISIQDIDQASQINKAIADSSNK